MQAFRNANVTTVASNGQIANSSLVAHTERLQRHFYEVRSKVWCMVGNGLSNQVFVEGPDGVIAIDSGESVEEMSAALAELREVCDRPVVAVIYSHFHYVNGTAAVFDGSQEPDEVWGHALIETNLARMASEIGPVARRGLILQFGTDLPEEGPDGLVNVGLGLRYRQAEHAPFTPGFVPPTHTIDTETETSIAGLRVVLRPAPSDADDNLTIWFPDLGVCVNNLVWPALFNVFALRGEEYRDPRILLDGIDHIIELGADHLIGAHGPPISGASRITEEVTAYRDSIQFLWDQTVRHVNQGLTSSEVGAAVELPAVFNDSYLTQQHYGLAEHHARQIYAGLRGWFDGDPANLFPLDPNDRAQRMIDGFGGPERVRVLCDEACGSGDLRWALELAGWLTRSPDCEPHDQRRLATALRLIGQRTTSANVRNWALTTAREAEGTADLSRHRTFGFGYRAALTTDPGAALASLRVAVDPDAAVGADGVVAFVVDGLTHTVQLRRCVLVPSDGIDPDVTVVLDRTCFAELLSGRLTIAEAEAARRLEIIGDRTRLQAFCGAIELAGFVL